jgi:hypothetical protein
MTEANTTGPDRRIHERKKLRSTAQLLLLGRKFDVRTLDVSVSGVGIICSANPAAKTACSIRLSIPTKPSGFVLLELHAMVVHSVFSSANDGFSVGLLFVAPSAEAAAAISSYVGR